MDSVIASYGKGKLTCFPGSLNTILDVIPVDMVVNAIVVAMEVHHTNHQCSCETIYHVSSSFKNPIKILDLLKFMHGYFTRSPRVDGNGQRVKVDKLTMFSTADRFCRYMQIKYIFPLKVLYLVNVLSFQRFRKVYTNLDRKIKFAIQLAEFYKPYVLFNGIFDDRNLGKLQRVAEERGVDLCEFNFDAKTIDWEDYIMNIHIPGLLKHAIKS